VAKKSYEEKYTHPELREEIKEEIKRSDKGGEPGQWSARKSQLLSQEYEKRGGGYKGEKDEQQQNLQRWTDEEWQTREGDAEARGGGPQGETKRYLPKEAWEKMSEEEQRATEEQKQRGSRRGEQHVSNTQEARQARKDSQGPPLKNYDDLNADEISKKAKGLSKDDIRSLLDHEKAHRNRKTVVEDLERRLR
jgi:hypothetical protein